LSQADHLNTPRLVADATGATLWKWNQAEPFGVNVPDENPSGLGTFDLPLRFPGQYFDRETNLYYNYFRDYDPSIGRFSESDPIGLRGGLNTYAYAGSDPVRRSDPSGLAVWLCLRPIHGIPIGNHTYFYDDKTSRCCGDPGPGAKNPLSTCKEAGPRSDTCVVISSSDADADKLLNCCNTKTNKQVYFPIWNDCQDVADDCIREIGMAPPESKSTNRWKRCPTCWIK
jgi:RHS repeat-associated protein